MGENKKAKKLIVIAGILILAALAVYPAVKRKINEYTMKDISLKQQQTLGSMEEIARQKESRQEENDKGNEEMAVQTEAACTNEFSKVLLRIEDGSQKMKISLWQGSSGVCYFFLPGFAEGMGLIVDKIEGDSIQIGNAKLKQGDVFRDVLPEEAYEFAVYDEKGDTVLKAPVVFLYSSDLPVLSLTTFSGSMSMIDKDKTNKEAGRVVLLDETGEEVYAGEVESIEGRGNTTWALSKKPYQFKLCEKVDFFGFGASKAWNLIANGYDETRLRNKIVMGLAKELEMPYVPQGQALDLYINDIYYGNYYLTEKVQVEDERVDIRDMESVINTLYDTEELEQLERLQNEEGTRKWTGIDYEDRDLSGGYLFERELLERFKDEVSGFVVGQGDCYALKSPAYASENQVSYIADLMQEFQDAVESPDGIHPETGKHYSEYIDVTSFVQKYLVEEISKNYDGGVTSSFFYKPQDMVSHKIFAGPAWDYDLVFGNCNLDKIISNPIGVTKLSNHIYGTKLFAELYEKEDFYAQMTKMYEEKALPYLNYLLEEGIDQMSKEIRQSVKMDDIRWEDLENRYQYYEEYDNNVRYLKYFIERRRDFLNEVWLEGETYHNVTFMVDGEAWRIACIKDGETPGEEPVPSRYSALFMGWATQEGIPYDQYKPIYEDAIFYSIWQELPVEDIVTLP